MKARDMSGADLPGFECLRGVWTRAGAAVHLDGEDGVQVSAFTTDRARLCLWTARFDGSAPAAAVIATAMMAAEGGAS